MEYNLFQVINWHMDSQDIANIMNIKQCITMAAL